MKALKIVGKIAAAYWFVNATFVTVAHFGHECGDESKRFYKEHGRYKNLEEIKDDLNDDFINGCKNIKKLIEYKLHN